MKKVLVSILFLILSLSAQNKKVYYAYIEGDIDLGLAPYVKRVVSEAEKNLADAVIFKIELMQLLKLKMQYLTAKSKPLHLLIKEQYLLEH